MARNGFLFDYEYCSGCYTCEVACQSEHDMPLEQWGIKILQHGPWPIKDAEGNPTDRYVYDFVPTLTHLCDSCIDRLDRGKDPSCVHHCQARIIKYGPVEELAKEMNDKPWQMLLVPPQG